MARPSFKEVSLYVIQSYRLLLLYQFDCRLDPKPLPSPLLVPG